MNVPAEIRRWVVLGCVVVALCFALAIFTTCTNQNRDDNRTQVATGKALDRVAVEAPKIRDDQEEKQRAVDEIEGADQPLPDGFAGDLQRLRDRSANPR